MMIHSEKDYPPLYLIIIFLYKNISPSTVFKFFICAVFNIIPIVTLNSLIQLVKIGFWLISFSVLIQSYNQLIYWSRAKWFCGGYQMKILNFYEIPDENYISR